MARAAAARGADTRHAQLQRRVDALPVDDPKRDELLQEMEAIERDAKTLAPAPAASAPASSGLTWKGGGGNGAGIILGFFLWVWVILPAIKTDPKTKQPGGFAASKAVLAAKFLNRGPDGKELP